MARCFEGSWSRALALVRFSSKSVFKPGQQQLGSRRSFYGVVLELKQHALPGTRWTNAFSAARTSEWSILTTSLRGWPASERASAVELHPRIIIFNKWHTTELWVSFTEGKRLPLTSSLLHFLILFLRFKSLCDVLWPSKMTLAVC